MSFRPTDGDRNGFFSLRAVIPNNISSSTLVTDHESLSDNIGEHAPLHAPTKKTFQLNLGHHSPANAQVPDNIPCSRECASRIERMNQLSVDDKNNLRRYEKQVSQAEKQNTRIKAELANSVTKYNQASVAASDERKAMRGRVQTDGKLISDLKTRIASSGRDNHLLVSDIRGLKEQYTDNVAAVESELTKTRVKLDGTQKEMETSIHAHGEEVHALHVRIEAYAKELSTFKQETTIQVQTYVDQIDTLTSEISSIQDTNRLALEEQKTVVNSLETQLGELKLQTLHIDTRTERQTTPRPDISTREGDIVLKDDVSLIRSSIEVIRDEQLKQQGSHQVCQEIALLREQVFHALAEMKLCNGEVGAVESADLTHEPTKIVHETPPYDVFATRRSPIQGFSTNCTFGAARELSSTEIAGASFDTDIGSLAPSALAIQAAVGDFLTLMAANINEPLINPTPP